MNKLIEAWREKRKTQYKEKITQDWDWEKIKLDATLNAKTAEEGVAIMDSWLDEGERVGYVYLGKVYDEFPSGKFYAPWSNVSRLDRERDALFMEAFEAVAEEHGLFMTNGDADPTDILVGILLDRETSGAK